MKLLATTILLLAVSGLRFEITDVRGKKPAGVSIEAGLADLDGWYSLKVKSEKRGSDFVLVWPFDDKAATPDGPEPVPAIVIQRGDERALTNPVVCAAIATPVVLGIRTVEETADRTGIPANRLLEAFASLASASDPFAKGVGLLYAKRAEDAAETLGRTLRERQRRLTRVPSEIYALAVLEGRALMLNNKFDAASVAFLVAAKERPSDAMARDARSEALIKAGKPEAARELKKR